MVTNHPLIYLGAEAVHQKDQPVHLQDAPVGKKAEPVPLGAELVRNKE